MAWLVTGGAGYIGAHVVRALLASGRDVVVLDDLSTGRRDRIPAGVPVVSGEVRSRRALRRALRESGVTITGVVHLASRAGAASSVSEPLQYWSANVGGLQVLLEELVDAGIRQVILGSSAAVYGQSLMALDGRARVSESTPALPVTPLGATQWAAEQMVGAAAHAHGWKALSLRLFSVAGAGSPQLGTTQADGLIPRVLAVRQEGGRPRIYGEDFPTPDGSLVRDIVHVTDVAAAFLAAARVVEAAYLASATSQEALSAVKSAGERVHTAAVRAEHDARKLPGAGLVAGMASGVPAAAEVASIVAARAFERLPGASRAMDMAAESFDGALGSVTSDGLREQVTGVASQLGSIVAKVAGVEDAPRLRDHLAVNIGTGRGHSAFDVIEALRASTGEPFAVDIVGRRAGDPAFVVASTDMASSLLGWHARIGLREVTDSAWAAWRRDHPQGPATPDPS